MSQKTHRELGYWQASRRQVLATLPLLAISPAADAMPPAPGVIVVAGIRRIDHDVTIEEPVTLQPGASFAIARGATLTLLGDLVAPAVQVFDGPGHVDLTRSRIVAARPEWWGAKPNDAAVDCGAALAACLRAHTAMQLGPGDYHIAKTWAVDQPNRRIWGIGRTANTRGTRLVLTAGDGPVIRVGSEQAPPEINAYLPGIDLRWLAIGRATAAATPAGDDAAAATGLAIRHVLDSVFEGVHADEHAIGFSVRGAVRTFLRDCAAFRSLFTLPAQDVFIGFDMDGRAAPIATGANASLYLVDCVARTGNRPRLRRSVGCRLQGAFSDTFLVRFETTEVDTGIEVEGRAAALTDTGRQFGQIDLHLETPVLDQCVVGISLSGLSQHALVDISAPYVALAPGGRAAMAVNQCGGLVSITGGQFIGSLAPASVGLSLVSVTGMAAAGLKLAGFGRPIEAVNASGLDLVVAVNTAGATSAGAPAVRLADCRDSYLRPRIAGPAAVHAVAVRIDGSAGVTVETAGIDRHTVTVPVSVGGRATAPPPGTSTVTVAAVMP